MTKQTKSYCLVLLLIITVFNVGCTGRLTRIATQPTEIQKNYGQTSGKACGSLLLGIPSVAFIPAGLNSRIYRAHQAALRKKPGATKLENVTLEENWFWWVLGTTRCTAVTGEAVR